MSGSRLGPAVPLVLAGLLAAACTTRITVPANDPTPPDVTLKQLANPQSPTIRRAGTPGSRPFRDVVSGRDRLALLGHGEDIDGGVKSVFVTGEVTTTCVGTSGIRDLAADNRRVPFTSSERQTPSGGNARTTLNTVLHIALADVVDAVRSRCEPGFRVTDRHWISGEFTATATNFSNLSVETHAYEFLWKPCTEETRGGTTDLVVISGSPDRYRILSNNQWTSFPISGGEGPGVPSWSPCKDRIVFAAEPTSDTLAMRDLFIADRNGNVHRLTDPAVCKSLFARATQVDEDNLQTVPACVFSDPDWSAANEVATAVQFFTQDSPSAHFLVIIQPDGPDFRLIRLSHDNLQVGVWEPKWSRYGDRLIFSTLTAPDIPLAQGLFVTKPAFREVCKLDFGGRPMAWADADGPGGTSRVAFVRDNGIHVLELNAPAGISDCPTILGDAPLPGSIAGDRAPAVSFLDGDFAFLRGTGSSTEVMRESGANILSHTTPPGGAASLDF